MGEAAPVFWGEGMFLRPHHLQAAERFREESLRREILRVQPFGWGIVRLEVAAAPLENFGFELRAAEVRLKDGTALSLGSTLNVAPRPFKDELERARGRLAVHLGIPVYRAAGPNVLVGDVPGGRERRYLADSVDMLDENTGGNPQPVTVRRLNGRLFFGDESREGFECLEIAHLERSGRGANAPVLAADFIPPLLEVGASPVLQDIGEGILHRLEAKRRLLLTELAEGRLTTEAAGATAWKPILKLQILGSSTFLLEQLVRLPRLHPFTLYAELCRLAGELSIFHDGSAFRLPVYDHDQLGACFRRVADVLIMLLDRAVDSPFVRLEFAREQELLVAALRAEWIAGGEMYVALETELDEARLATRLAVVKASAPGDAPVLRQRRLHGLGLTRLKRVPPGLPVREDTHYFALRREEPYWSALAREQRLALSEADDPDLRFCLYALGPGAKP
jgi:type VI secretion system protein ImpJ